ncbi:MAG TPA: hypothetical protein PLM75_12635, partial [bacterium]|nr:hypothetical protein [bacterium]
SKKIFNIFIFLFLFFLIADKVFAAPPVLPKLTVGIEEARNPRDVALLLKFYLFLRYFRLHRE